MSKVAVSLNGRAFTIGCEPGQEAYLRELAAYLDDKVSGMAGQVGQIGDLRLLLMASLVVVDELRESEKRVEGLEAHVDRLRHEGQGLEDQLISDRATAAERLIKVAERLETLVDSVEQADLPPLFADART
ncbi:cell division protein ZapA [Maricaulis sp. D1M11]|uniref:cell division protein ZapA n=1 Tax=Maricaulis sp. D1M11 TaxID=3076117 RepID=UPI0039B4566C